MRAVILRGEGAEIFMATVFTALEIIRAVLMKGPSPAPWSFSTTSSTPVKHSEKGGIHRWYPGIKQLSCTEDY